MFIFYSKREDEYLSKFIGRRLLIPLLIPLFLYQIFILTNVLFSFYPAGVYLHHYRIFDLDLADKCQITFRSSRRPEVLYKTGVLLNISQNSEENTCARVYFFNKVADLSLQVY